MTLIYEVAFKGERREFFHNPQNLTIHVGDFVIVQADRGENIGRVALLCDSSSHKMIPEPKREILRKATESDVNKLNENKKQEDEAFLVCRQKIVEHSLKMKLVDVEYQYDGNKITFFFTADKRIDFRSLVRDLASIYRTRIELRQIGVRDEARRLGGVGICGRRLCCNTFLGEFEPITSQMARNQHLSLSPTKISGVCGRLMCCLAFEEEYYKNIIEMLPKIGTTYKWRGEIWEVVSNDIFGPTVTLKNKDGEEMTVELKKVQDLQEQKSSKKEFESD